MKKRLVLIDGSSLIFRAFYAIRHLTTTDGIFTNGVYGFLNMYYGLMENYNPDYIGVAFDKSGPTFRHKDYEQYKGHRQETPSELSSQFGILKDVLDSLNIKHIALDDYEADDIIGTLAKEGAKEGMEVFLVTGDRDYLQLIDDNIKVLLTKKGISQLEEYDEKRILEDYGITPIQLIEVKGLMGDASDNIPGVPGVGEKTALKYIRNYGSIDGLYENIDEITGKATKQKIVDNKDLAYLSRSLGTIFTKVPLEYTVNDFLLQEPNYEELEEKYEKLEFSSFLAKLPTQEVKREESFSYVFLEGEEFPHWDKENMVFHIFYDGENYIYGDPKYIAFKKEEEAVVNILPFDKKEQFVEEYRNVLESEEILKISYDIKSDLYYLFEDVNFKNYEDLTIAEYLIDPSRSKYEIDKSAKIYLNRNLHSLEDLVGKGKKTLSLSDVDKEKLGSYISMYLSLTEDLREKLLSYIDERDMKELYYDIELPLVKVLASMEREGIYVNKDYLIELGEEFQKELDELEKEIYSYAGYEFNINSTKQLGEVLFEKLNLPVIKKTKTGYSTNAEVLHKLKGSHEIIEAILRYRTLKKLTTTYIDGFITLISEEGKIHSLFNQNITATGRISSQDPNLQNIPIKTEEGRKIRKAFIPPENYSFVGGDYSQVELRVLAHLSGDEVMIEAFKEDADIHTKTASEVFHVDFEDVTPLQRSNAKAVNFGIVYGISDYGLSQDLDISRKEAKEYIDNYLDTYKKIKTYMADIVETGKKQGYVETIMHRRRYIPELESKNRNIRSFGERVALNTPIQGSAADIIKIAMVEIYQELQEKQLRGKLILQVHDELIIQVEDGDIDEVKELLSNVMSHAVELDLPLKVDINSGKTWYDAK